ncbi:MAG: hypothetical protein NZL95_06930 [Chitinophagales bacterium]|nr:hypothetical protein [Chitinophagales bacterium]MDW8428271.1 hypothetical protein [Chitinophagales bacterium]
MTKLATHAMTKALSISALLCLGACLRPPDYSIIPTIALDSLSTLYIRAGVDSLKFFISFTDGDGDIGSETNPNLFLTDSRTGYTDSVKVPYITPDGSLKAISGVIIYVRSQFSCIPGRKTDSLTYTIYLEDRAGHASNSVTTPVIYLECQ